MKQGLVSDTITTVGFGGLLMCVKLSVSASCTRGS